MQFRNNQSSKTNLNETINQRSSIQSSSRGSSAANLPASTTNPFCRDCLRNQEIQIKLLSDFDEDGLPLVTLTEYQHYLDEKFPICCQKCYPAVQSIIQTRDYKATSHSLGARLKETNRWKETKLQRGRKENYWHWLVLGLIWRIRGILWWSTTIGFIGLLGFLGFYDSTYIISIPSHAFSIFTFNCISTLWSFYHPLWNQARKMEAKGKLVRIENRDWWISLQIASYAIRCTLSAYIVFQPNSSPIQSICGSSSVALAVLLVISKSIIHIREPAPLQFHSTPRHFESPTPPTDELDFISHLSLSQFPSFANGDSKPSHSSKSSPLNLRLHQPSSQTFGETTFGIKSLPVESMDWTPSTEDNFQFGRQRFFPPGAEADGLEELLGNVMMDEVIEKKQELKKPPERDWKNWFWK